MIDFHTHVLPGIDDGCSTVEESIEILKYMWSNGIKTVVATPHYYREKSSIDFFLGQRDEAYNKILAAAESSNIRIPEILLGAEVSYFPGMSRFEKIEQLCIGNTKYILLEMPFGKWDSFIIGELEKLIASRGIIPIIAHVERYSGYKSMIAELVKLQLPLQINASSLFKLQTSFFLLKRIRDGSIQVIGSDCHNMYSRPPNVHLAMEKIEKKLGSSYFKKLKKVWHLMLSCVRRE